MKKSWPWAVAATAFLSLGVGWGAQNFLFFKAQADASDYSTAAGAYGAGAVVLLLTGLALTSQHSRKLSIFTLSIAFLLMLNAIWAWAKACLASNSTTVDVMPSDFLGGIGGVLWAPWIWIMIVVSLRILSKDAGLRYKNTQASRK